MSAQFSLQSADLKKIGIGALVALGGALMTYLSQYIANTNFGQWTPLVMAVWSILVNVARKWVTVTP